MAAHESPRTTSLCDRNGNELTLEEIERVLFSGKLTPLYAKQIDIEQTGCDSL